MNVPTRPSQIPRLPITVVNECLELLERREAYLSSLVAGEIISVADGLKKTLDDLLKGGTHLNLADIGIENVNFRIRTPDGLDVTQACGPDITGLLYKNFRERLFPNVNMASVVFSPETGLHRSCFFLFDKEHANPLIAKELADNAALKIDTIILPILDSMVSCWEDFLSKWKKESFFEESLAKAAIADMAKVLKTYECRLQARAITAAVLAAEHSLVYSRSARLPCVRLPPNVFSVETVAYDNEVGRRGIFAWQTPENKVISYDNEHADIFKEYPRHTLWWIIYLIKCSLSSNRYAAYYSNPSASRGARSGVVVVADLGDADVAINRSSAVQLLASGIEGILERTVTAHVTRKMKQSQRLAASAAILARNFSHHIGSHVSPRAGAEQIAARLRQFDPDIEESPLAMFKAVARMKDIVDEYARQKADFLAEIATEPVSSCTSAWFYREVMLPFIQNTVLMDCLAANEGLRYRDWTDSGLRLKVHIREQDGATRLVRPRNISCPDENFVAPFGLYSLDSGVDDRWAPVLPQDTVDLSVALPGALGRFTVFSILENLIRNSAKHNRDRLRERDIHSLTLNIDLADEGDDSFYTLRIYDDCTDPNKMDDNGVPLAKRLQELLDREIIQSDGSVRREAWGMAELMICGNLLMGQSVFTNENCGQGVPVLARSMTEQDLGIKNASDCDKSRMVFEFKVLKARRALLVGNRITRLLLGDDAGEAKEQMRRAWLRAGIVMREGWAHTDQCKGCEASSLSAFQIVLTEQGIPDMCREHLPFRIIRVEPHPEREQQTSELFDVKTGDRVLSELPFAQDTNYSPDQAEKLLRDLWSFWCGRWQGNSVQGLVSVYLDEIGDAKSVAKPWAEHCTNHNDARPAPHVLLETGWTNNPAIDGIPPVTLDDGIYSPCVYFDRHGGALGTRHIPTLRDSYIAFDKNSSDFATIFDPVFPRERGVPWLFPYELFEAGMLRVLILDERILERAMEPVTDDHTISKTQNILLEKHSVQPRMWHVAAWAKVYVATHLKINTDEPSPFRAADLEVQTESDRKKHIQLITQTAVHADPVIHAWTEWASSASNKKPGKNHQSCPMLEVDLSMETARLTFRRFTPDDPDQNANELSNNRVDVVVVHQGVLDRLRDNHKIKQKKAMKLLHGLCPWVVIESGRGIPPEVQMGDGKFLPFSALEPCFAGGRLAKLTLCRKLMERTRVKGTF